ncbi:peptidase [Streptomyces sp. NBC_00996]|uniref:COG1470 family protein n=1 Tax=Streptomyces sp. NBC_00996 TaxID=2903710 RepID=UPI0038686DA2|nr:peptidase [Streptomyces sp. NBC_00996]
MHKYIPAGALGLLALAGTIGAPPSATASPRVAAEGTDVHGSFSVRLVDVPASLVNDTRARQYIIDNLHPGATIRRRVEVANTSDEPARVVVYPSAARIRHGSFIGAFGRQRSELTSWTSLSRKRLEVPAHSTARTSVTIRVPRDAAPGERYGVIWAQMSGGAGPGVTLVNRAGIRLYLSVGGHNPPPTKFTVDTMTAERDRAGRAIVKAQVHNTGGRALDLSGTLNLSKVRGSINAGPYAVQLGTTLAPGQSEPVTVPVTDQVANGPWKATLNLKSGLYEETYRARITFPRHRGHGRPVPAHAVVGGRHMAFYGGAAGLALGGVILPAVMLRRRKAASQDT